MKRVLIMLAILALIPAQALAYDIADSLRQPLDVSGEMTVVAGILGGTLAASSHVMKAGSRVLINASPEPFSNWTASVVEDVSVISAVWLALYHPVLMILFLVLFALLAVWLLPKIWRGIKKVFGVIARLFGAPAPGAPAPDISDRKIEG